MVLLWYRERKKSLHPSSSSPMKNSSSKKGQTVFFRLSSLFSHSLALGLSPFRISSSVPLPFFNRGLRFLFLQRGGGGRTELDEKEEEKEI